MKLVIKSTTWNIVFPKVQDYQTVLFLQELSAPSKKNFLKFVTTLTTKCFLKFTAKVYQPLLPYINQDIFHWLVTNLATYLSLTGLLFFSYLISFFCLFFHSCHSKMAKGTLQKKRWVHEITTTKKTFSSGDLANKLIYWDWIAI